MIFNFISYENLFCFLFYLVFLFLFLGGFMYYFILLIVFGFIDVITDICLQHYCIRKCHFDCSKCKNWRCYKKFCDKRRNKF